MKKYVAGFMFSPDYENVILIEKNKPEWQAGKYNAVGGKIEQGESPIEAMVREFQEEAWIRTKPEDWNFLCKIGEPEKYEVFFYFCSYKQWRDYLSETDEQVFHIPVMDLHHIRHLLLDNLNWLIPMAIDKAVKYSGEIITELN